jgi:hypothetical protein
MKTSLLNEELFKEKLRQQWALWIHQRRLYPDLPMWWGMYAKKRLVSSAFRKGSNAGETS